MTDTSLRQLELVYDYIKFHIGLYLATPPVIGLLADTLKMNPSAHYNLCFGLMVLIFLFSGAHAGLFMGRYLLKPWDEEVLRRFKVAAFARSRRVIHHSLYWAGLLCGLVGLGLGLLLEGVQAK